MTMAVFAGREHRSCGDVQGCKEGCSAVTNIVMGNTLYVAQSHWQNWLSTIQGLNLALFIDTKNHGFVRRIQIEPHDIADLFYEEGIGR